MKKLTLITLLLFSINTFCQNQVATLIFKNGTQLSGLASITGNTIKFREEKGAKKQKFDHTTIKSLILRVDDKDVEFLYKIVENSGNILLLEVLKSGKVTLYRDIKQGTSPGMGMNMGGGFGGGMAMGFGFGNSYSISSYYVNKDQKEEVTHLGDRGSLFSKNFKKAAIDYFKDCPSLISKIESNELKKRDVVDIVDFYNKNCGF